MHDLNGAGYIDTTPNGDVSLTELGREAIRKEREDLLRDSDPDFDVEEDDDLLEEDGVTIEPGSMVMDVGPRKLDNMNMRATLFEKAVIDFISAQIVNRAYSEMTAERMIKNAVAMTRKTFGAINDIHRAEYNKKAKQ